MNLPFSNVIEVWMGEFCTNIFVFGRPEQPCALFVTWSVIDPLEFEFGMMPFSALPGSSKDVDLMPLADVEVVTLDDEELAIIPLDFISRCLGELRGEFSKWLDCDWATVDADPCDESKLECPLFLLNDRLLLPLSIEDGPEVTNDDVFPLSRLEGPL